MNTAPKTNQKKYKHPVCGVFNMCVRLGLRIRIKQTTLCNLTYNSALFTSFDLFEKWIEYAIWYLYIQAESYKLVDLIDLSLSAHTEFGESWNRFASLHLYHGDGDNTMAVWFMSHS